MVSVILSRIVILFCGTLYPAYRSYKTVKTKNVREYVKWMMYWIVFAVFLCTEALLDFFVSFWFPFYYEVKILFVIWLLSPYTKGASFVYRKFIHPLLVRHEEDIDQYLNKAKTDSYSTLMRIGSKSILYAKEAFANAAIRGQEQLVSQLRKSYSLGDVSEVNVDNDFADLSRRRRETINALQGLKEEGDNEEDERVWEGHYDNGGKKVEKEMMDFIDGDDNANRTQKATSSVTKDDTATTRTAAKSQIKKKETDIYATMTSRRPINIRSTATPTKKQ